MVHFVVVASERLQSAPVLTVSGVQTAPLVAVAQQVSEGLHWTYSVTVSSTASEQQITFSITTPADLAGNAGLGPTDQLTSGGVRVTVGKILTKLLVWSH